MNGVVQLLTRFGAARLGAMGAVTLALIGFFAFVILRMSQPAMGVLFTDMSSPDAASVVRELDARGVRYDLKEDGQTILAPRSDLSRLRMELAGKGLPSSGSVGYEIFDKGDAFSSTSFVQNINHVRALEGELSRTIRTIARVAGARVHLAMPERRLFERDKEPPRASIALKLRGDLSAEQVQAIRHLVASAVEGLTPDHVSIVDERGRLLADGAGGSESAVTASTGEDKRIAMERRLRSQVEEIVAGIVGAGRARVQVAAELDLSRLESRSESFDPEGRVVRSTQTRGEASATSGNEGQVSVGTELPGAKEAAEKPSASKDSASKTEEVVNYEISRTTRTEVQQAGRLKRLSVAVLVDGVYARGASGEPGYQPRTKEDLDRIATLVRTAVGFDKARGDQVEVVNLPFAEQSLPAEAETPSLLASLMSPSKDDVMRWIELGVMSLLTVMVLMLVVRPMVKRVLAPDALGVPRLAIASGGPAALTDGSRAPGPSDDAAAAASAASRETVAALAAEQMTRLGDLSKTQPKQAAAVLRGWMAEK